MRKVSESRMDEKQRLARIKRRKMMLEEPMLRVIPKVAVPMIISNNPHFLRFGWTFVQLWT